MCSKENIQHNIEKRKHAWCSSSDCGCARYLAKEISYSELQNIMRIDGSICYESVALRDWQMDMGWDLTTPQGAPRKLPEYVRRNSLCVLTTREPNATEAQHIVFAAFLVKEFSEGNTISEAGCVIADDEYRISLTTEEARKILLWEYYANRNNPLNPRWGTGLTRSMDNDNAVALLAEIIKAKNGKKDELQAKKLYMRYCELNNYDFDNPPEKKVH